MQRPRVSTVLAAALLVCVGTTLIGCAAPDRPDAGEEQAPGPEGAREALLEAHQALADAYQRGNVDDFLLLLEKSDDLLIYHPRMDDRFTGIDEARERLPSMFERLGKPTWLDVHVRARVEGGVGWVTSHVVIESNGIDEPFTGRGTEVWVLRDSGWRLAHGHWSANPEF
jgi:hypothetical protein